MGTPMYLSEEERHAAFKAGWSHTWNEQEQVGYYIGRPHPPFTECRVVQSLAPNAAGDYDDCADGEPGQLLTRGDNLMSGYVGNPQATQKAMGAGGWYTNLGDICFRLRNATDGGHDYYWLSRDSALLIRGGARRRRRNERTRERACGNVPRAARRPRGALGEHTPAQHMRALEWA
jgi:acyl-CoA synthetase (AMP-forming)/AMP-acid ligase II